MALPNFFIAGAPKAGTTALYHYLDQHPQIYLSPIKEPGFFAAQDFATHALRDELLRKVPADCARLRAYLDGPMREKRDHGLVLDWDDYLRLFRNVRDEAAIGEASVAYFWLEGCAAAIHARLPEARVILMLRNPADRLFSQYLASLEAQPSRSFRACFEAGLDPSNFESSWLAIGRYATHVERFFKVFSRKQVLVCFYDDYVADLRKTLRDVLTFLGVDPDCKVDAKQRHNEPRVPRFARLDALLRDIRRRGLAGRLLPAPILRKAKAVYYRGRSSLEMNEADRRLVISYHREDIQRLQDLLGRDLTAWAESHGRLPGTAAGP